MQRWILLCLFASVSAYYGEMKCGSGHNCVLDDLYSGRGNFTVEDHKILFGYEVSMNLVRFDGFFVDCGGWAALESSSMPRFVAEYRTNTIMLKDCPLPAGSRSIVSLLQSFNVVVAPVDDEVKLLLKDVPSEPKLSSAHFSGLESLTSLSIFAAHSVEQLEPAAGFLSNLPKLRSLVLSAVKLPPNELHNLPNTLDWFKRTDQHMEPLHKTVSETVLALPGLRDLILEHKAYSENMEMYHINEEQEYNRKDRAPFSPSLKTLYISEWNDKKLEPFENCDGFRSITFVKINVEQLPERWVAACPQLEELIMYYSPKLTQIPEKLLEGATALKTLTIMRTKVTHLPDGLLQDIRNLKSLVLSGWPLHTLSSDVFRGSLLELETLDLCCNQLDNQALAALTNLKSLRSLDLSGNKLTGDVCDDEEYAPVRNMPLLESLDLTQNSVKTCKTWRSRFHRLVSLYPRPTLNY